MSDRQLTLFVEPGLVRAVGDIDLSNASELAEALMQPNSVVLDLAGVDFMDSTGMAVLVNARKHHLAQGNEFTVCRVQGMPRRAMQLMGLDYLYE